MRLGRAVVVDEDEGRLGAHAVGGPHIARLVDNVGERAHIEVGDEVVDGIKVVSTRDTDEVDLIAQCSLYLCDRRGFSSATSSPRCPEPEHGVGAFERAEIDLTAIGGGNHAGLDGLRGRGVGHAVA